MAQAQHPRDLAQLQDLNKQALERIKVAAAELTDAAVIGLLIAGPYAEGQILVTGRSVLREDTVPTPGT
jgi:hypothetical protein